MNVKELIEKYKDLYENVFDFGAKLACQLILQDLEQLDEPEKVKVPQCVVPQCVDDVIKGAREQSPELEDALHYTWGNGIKEFTEWYKKKSNRDLFARAWLDGYEVEKEKRYTVVAKATKQPLYYNAMDKKLFFSMGGLATKFTRKELEEADFGWVFDCPGIEVEEVE